MTPLNIELTEDAPAICLDKNKPKFSIIGESFPIDPENFYKPAINWLDEYLKNPNPETIFELHINYMNTSSTKVVTSLISMLKSLKGLKMIWYHEKDDLDSVDLGDDISYVTCVPFEYRVV